MINITINNTIDDNYYTDIFLKGFTLSPTPAGLIATITLLGLVKNHTTQSIQNKLDSGSWGITVSQSGNRDGVYIVNSKTIVPAVSEDLNGVGILFVGQRPFKQPGPSPA